MRSLPMSRVFPTHRAVPAAAPAENVSQRRTWNSRPQALRSPFCVGCRWGSRRALRGSDGVGVLEAFASAIRRRSRVAISRHRRTAAGRIVSLSPPDSLEKALGSGTAVQLPPRDGGAPVTVFGASHCEAQPHIAEYILKARPGIVVVETALTPEMGAETGNQYRPGEQVMGPSAFMVQMWSRVAFELSKEPEPLESAIWDQIRVQFNGEQLAYIAALTVDSTLVFGDRPRQPTFHRLFNVPTTRDLDEAFGNQSAANYAEMITGSSSGGRSPGVFTQVFLEERDAVMTESLFKASQACGPSGLVVGVVGENHVPGIAELWEAGNWQPLAKAAMEICSSSEPFLDDEHAAVKRALLERLVCLSCPPDVLPDLNQALGPLAPEQEDPYSWTTELYGSWRMLMAVLPREVLEKVCQGRGCDFYDALEPLRAMRPMNGGKGYDPEEINKLRMLHFQLNTGPAPQ